MTPCSCGGPETCAIPEDCQRTLPPSSDDGPYGVWIKTKELGWFRSAVRGTEEAANRLANELRKNFKEVEVR